MDDGLQQRFLNLWQKYFPEQEIPIAFYYTDSDRVGEPVIAAKSQRCLICELSRVRKGRTLRFGEDSFSCRGGESYLGFSREQSPDIEYFLSCGLPGKFDGLRYRKSPELVRENMAFNPPLQTSYRYIVFSRWDRLDPADDPLAVDFFATPDILSALHTLACFDEADPDAVRSPSGAGCASLVYYPLRESEQERPRAIMGMFDLSARPCVKSPVFTLSVPMSKFSRMIDSMEESFLSLEPWRELMKRNSGERLST